MLKYGTNLLQVVGQFSGMLEHRFSLTFLFLLLAIHLRSDPVYCLCKGNYIIVVAYMGVISNLDRPVLQDCVQPAVAALDSGMLMERNETKK